MKVYLGSASVKDIIYQEIDKLIIETKKSVNNVQTFAISEVWKILQLLIVAVIRLIENLGTDLSSPDKKELAMDLISSFYDKVFIYVDIPWVPSVVEPVIHSHLKSFLMILVSSGIDAMVTTFRQVGVLQTKTIVTLQSDLFSNEKIISNFINDLKKIVRI